MATLSLDDKPWWVGVIVGVVLFAAIVWGVKAYLIDPIDSKIRDAESTIAELDKKIEQGRSAQRKLPQFREEVRRLELELEAAHFFAELRKLALGGAALFDLLVQLRDLPLGDLDVLVDFADVEIVRGEDQAARE